MFNAAVFVRKSGASGFGHVGWAFAIDATTFDDGSVENPPGTPFTPPSEDGFWECEVSAGHFVKPFVPMGYDHYKTLTAPNPDPDAALQTVNWIRTQPYNLFGQNCEDDVYDVLRAFGVPDLPAPTWLDAIPNKWFADLPGTALPVSWNARAWRNGHAGQAKDRVIPQIKPSPSILYPGFPPLWRIPGTEEFEKFQREMSGPAQRGKRRPVPSRKMRRREIRA
jgi:hypothetical protein